MPPLEQMDCDTPTVLWPRIGYSGDSQPYVSQAGRAVIYTRWKKVRKQATDAFDNTITIDAKLKALQTIPIGSIVWEGDEDDIPGTGFVPSSNLYMVFSQDEATDLKGRETAFEYNLVRYNDTLPLSAS